MTFEEFVTARLPAFVRFAAVLTGDKALADDVVQEVLARAHVRWRKISKLADPEAYVRRMLINEHLSVRRRWRQVFIREAPVERMDNDAVPHAEQHAERDALRRELALLPRRQRTVLVLRYYLGHTDNEIADLLGCTAGTVRGYASRALATLRVRQGSANPDSSVPQSHTDLSRQRVTTLSPHAGRS